VARGFGALGYTMQLPLEERYLMQKGDLLNQAAILLGGRAAEEIAVGEISTGAQNDLQRVTDVARSMVTEWGMSDKLGTVNYDPRRRNRFLDVGWTTERGLYSEETARLIDEEVKAIVAGAHNEARRILRENRDVLERVTRTLLEKEVMEGDELRSMMTAPRAVNL
jgi:cell division protease FtsH